MADLFQSQFDHGNLRRGVQDGETLWNLLAEDGTLAVVPDPTEPEVLAAAEKLGKIDPDDEEKQNAPETKALARIASFQAPAGAEQLPAEEEDEGNGRRRQSEAKAEARS
jgi:hypothetical protein